MLVHLMDVHIQERQYFKERLIWNEFEISNDYLKSISALNSIPYLQNTKRKHYHTWIRIDKYYFIHEWNDSIHTMPPALLFLMMMMMIMMMSLTYTTDEHFRAPVYLLLFIWRTTTWYTTHTGRL